MDEKTAIGVVQDMAEQRAQAVKRDLTIEGAVAKALWLRKQPESLLDDKSAKGLIDALLAALEYSTCYLNAVVKGEDVFVLRQQDRAAPAAIATWAEVAADHGCGIEKTGSALAKAIKWRKLPVTETKWPD